MVLDRSCLIRYIFEANVARIILLVCSLLNISPKASSTTDSDADIDIVFEEDEEGLPETELQDDSDIVFEEDVIDEDT